MNIGEILTLGKKILSQPDGKNDKSTASLDAKLLLLSLDENLSEIDTIANREKHISQEIESKFLSLLEKRKEGYSTSSIIGKRYFYNLQFATSKDTLAPRSDTETLVEYCINYAKKNLSGCLKMLDICTGTGCIGISVAKHLGCDVILSDISWKSLGVAIKNKDMLYKNAEVIQSDLFEKFSGQKFDIITANPPYIDEKEYENLAWEVKNEPHIALFSPDGGMYHIKKIIKDSKNYLKEKSILLIEIGYDQGERALYFAKKIFTNSKLKIIKDLSGNDRVLSVEND